jgi:hypothetical protein
METPPAAASARRGETRRGERGRRGLGGGAWGGFRLCPTPAEGRADGVPRLAGPQDPCNLAQVRRDRGEGGPRARGSRAGTVSRHRRPAANQNLPATFFLGWSPRKLGLLGSGSPATGPCASWAWALSTRQADGGDGLSREAPGPATSLPTLGFHLRAPPLPSVVPKLAWGWVWRWSSTRSQILVSLVIRWVTLS